MYLEGIYFKFGSFEVYQPKGYLDLLLLHQSPVPFQSKFSSDLVIRADESIEMVRTV